MSEASEPGDVEDWRESSKLGMSMRAKLKNQEGRRGWEEALVGRKLAEQA